VKAIIFGLFVALSFSVYAQSENPYADEESSGSVNFGVGLGLSYGGIGARLSVFPISHVGAFGAIGYNFHKAGYNIGGIFRMLPEKKVCPVLMGMYGYNGVVIVQGADQYNKTYYGPSFGAGAEIRFHDGQTFLNLELLLPLRSAQWDTDVDNLLNNPDIEITRPLPVTFSIGYHTKF
jgi:hypothetical protein